jgi:tetratricopeptide (TPR) repeat protein
VAISASTLLMAAALSAWGGQAALAQELPFRTGDVAAQPQCPAWEVPAPAGERMRDAARELSTAANQAVVVGDLERARELYQQASQLDGRSAELHYGLARVLEQKGELQPAFVTYCRVVALEAESSEAAGPAEDARLRRDALVDAMSVDVPYTARVVFERGARSVEAGRHADAAQQFGAAAERAPRWPEAFYNEGVALARIGRHGDAAGRLARYLELRPNAPDAVEVARRIGQLERASGTRSVGGSSTALALGFVVPGLGQFSSGRSAAGLAVLSAVAGAVAAGFLVREADVRCLTAPDPGASCPPEQVVSRTVTKPYLTHALVAAGAVTALAALEAWIRGPASAPSSGAFVAANGRELSLGAPGLSVGPDRSVDLVIVGLSLR